MAASQCCDAKLTGCSECAEENGSCGGMTEAVGGMGRDSFIGVPHVSIKHSGLAVRGED